MITQRYIEDLDVVLSKDVYFDKELKETYEVEFNELKTKGFIRADIDFYDKDWIFEVDTINHIIRVSVDELWFTRIAKEKSIPFSFLEFDLALRKFTFETVQLISVTTFKEFRKTLIKTLQYCSFFNIEKVDKLKEANKNPYKNPYKIQMVFDFIDFLDNFEIPNEYYEELESLINNSDETLSAVRQLPSFTSVFEFGDIMEDFVANASKTERAKYYPIIIWWFVSNRIPLRPTELLMLDSDCVNIVDDKYYLTVKRNTKKGNKRGAKKDSKKFLNTYKPQTIEVNEECYRLILGYQSITKEYLKEKSSNLLFDKEMYILFRKKNNQARKMNENTFTHTDFRYLLNEFYLEIVQERYKRTPVGRNDNIEEALSKNATVIEKLVPYDTRHMAIINLILMGNDHQTVMELAGHSNISTTVGYFNHMEEYAKGYSISYAKSLISRKIDIRDDSVDNVGLKVKDFQENIVVNENLANWEIVTKGTCEVEQKLTKVDGGSCRYHLMDYKPCISVEGIHSRCPYFISEDNSLAKIEVKNLTSQISTTIDTLRYLVENHKKISNFPSMYSTELESLRRKMNQNGIAISKIE